MAGRAATNILMYSHDTYGLGHIRRTMAIAEHLRAKDINVLILTGSPIAGRFHFPPQVDFVRIPGMIKMTNREYRPLAIKINPRHALDIRKHIITATAKSFQPDIFIVDKEPLGLKKEVLPTLKWLRRHRPDTQTVLGLRDIMDAAETVRQDWREKGVYKTLNDLYTEIWIYGRQQFYDPVQEYRIPQKIGRKIFFTGYIPRKIPDGNAVAQMKRDLKLNADHRLVVVTTGGGGDGYTVMDTYLAMLEAQKTPPAFRSILVTGPFMPKEQRRDIFKRARKLDVRVFHFYRRMELLIHVADLVVSMGGYNTICEILTQKTPSLIIPRETPRREQLIRAEVLKKQHLADYIPWKELTPERLRQKVTTLLDNGAAFSTAVADFRLTGLDIMRQRLEAFRKRQ